MILKITFLICMLSSNIFGEEQPSTYTTELPTLVNFETISIIGRNIFDSPGSISNAQTTPTTNLQPTLDQMQYYNNYAAAMYCEGLEKLDCTPCKQFKKDVDEYKVFRNESENTAGLVTVSKSREEIVVAFRGTNNFRNVQRDFAAKARSFDHVPEGMKIHTGFHKVTMSLYYQVVNYVGVFNKKYPNYKIVITGHSMGGAMARLTQFFYLVNGQFNETKYECYTFGEPRSGNKKFAEYMNAQNITTARVVHHADIVPHVPPTSMRNLLGGERFGDNYVHCQPEYYHSFFERRFCNTTVFEDPDCSISTNFAYNILDHMKYLGLHYAPGAIMNFIGNPGGILPVSAVLQPEELDEQLDEEPDITALPAPQLITNFA